MCMQRVVTPEKNEKPRAPGRTKIKFSHHQRMEYAFWHKHILETMNSKILKQGKEIATCTMTNIDCTVPDPLVKEELTFIFKEDYKCELTFDEIKKCVTISLLP